MFSLLLVLTIIMGSINLLNYRKIVRDADTVLSILSANNGTFPKTDNFKDGGEPMERDAFRPLSPELPYESRYFSVMLTGSGSILTTDTGMIAAIDTATAVEYARTIFEQKKTRGFVGNYRYIQAGSDQGTLIIFLDCGRNLSTFRTFLLTSCAISLLGLLAVFALIILLSGQIVKPVLESYEKQKRFITDAGHEIKTPLSIINADADVLEIDIGENEWLQDIQKQILHLTELTNNLICLSRMEEGQTQLQMIDFPFSDLAGETAQSFQALAKTQGKTFLCRIQPMLSLCGDAKALTQLISILLDNALKYSDKNGTISLSIEKQGKAVILSVYNTTESISRESLKHLFDRFYRADASRNSGTGGYGIGLSIAKAIVEGHKGKISASTQDGHSLSITVTLPA